MLPAIPRLLLPPSPLIRHSSGLRSLYYHLYTHYLPHSAVSWSVSLLLTDCRRRAVGPRCYPLSIRLNSFGVRTPLSCWGRRQAASGVGSSAPGGMSSAEDEPPGGSDGRSSPTRITLMDMTTTGGSAVKSNSLLTSTTTGGGTFSVDTSEAVYTTTTEGTASININKKGNARNGFTELMRAAYEGNAQRVAELVLRDAAKNKHVRLVKHGKLTGEGVSLLIEKDKKGKTALDWARIAHQNQVAHFLEQALMAQQKRQRKLESIENRRAELEGLLAHNAQAGRDLDRAIWDRDVPTMVRIVQSAPFSREEFRYAYQAIHVVAAGPEAGQPEERQAANAQDGDEEGGAVEQVEASEEAQHGTRSFERTYFLDWETRMGGTALILASIEADVEGVGMLADRGALLDHENRLGHTALTWASVCGHDEVVEVLIAKGADLQYCTRAEGKTALMHAAYNGAAACVNVLLDKLFDRVMGDKHMVEKRKKNLMEPEEFDRLMQGWMRSFEDSVNHRDMQGKSAMDYAQEKEHAQVVELLEMAQIRIDLRYKRIAQDQHQVEIVACSQGCGFEDKRELIEFHEVRDCPNKRAGCGDCGDLMPASRIRDHKQNDCPHRIVHCPNLSCGCVERLKFMLVDSHVRFGCRFRIVTCSLGCGAEMPFHSQLLHQSNYCVRRELPCELECGASLPKEEMKLHIKQHCPHRMVQCRVKGCKEVMRAGYLEFHETKVCVVPCRWGCGESIGPVWERTFHESSLCRRRPSPCPLNCGLLSCYGEHLDAHMTSYCPNRLEACRLGCGGVMVAKDLSLHEDPEKGSCPERLQRCRHDYQGKRILVRRHERRKARAAAAAEGGGGEVPAEEEEEEEELWLIKEYQAESGAYRMLVGQGDRYETHRLADLDFRVRDEATWTCGWISCSSMDHHLLHDCPSRLLTCPLGCGQRVRGGVVLERHVQHECTLSLADCPAGCGTPGLKLGDIFRHQEDDCPLRQVTCAYCGEHMVQQDAERHRSTVRVGEGECRALPVRCPLGCGQSMRKDEVDAHAAQLCSKRFLTCPLCQDPRIWADEMEGHQQHECPERTVTCPHPPCSQTMAGRLLDTHVSDECLHRLVACDCGQEVVAHDLDLHRKDTCLAALRPCNLGCGKQVRLMDMELHQRAESEGGDCDRHYLLDGKVVECPLGCGEQLTFYQQMQHLSLYCENRLVECPRRSECGESMPFRMLAGHQAVCPARVVSCGCEDRDCARTLRCWLEQRASRATGEAGEEQEEGQAEEAPACSLVACDQHGSTALAWAVHHHDVVLARHLLDLLHSQGTAVVAAALRAEDHVTGSTPLTIACARGADDLVHMMLERGATVNFETSSGRTPLIEAAKAGHLGVAKLLVKFGAVVEYVPRHRKTAIDHADWAGHQELLEFLVFTYRVQTEARQLFIMIARHDFSAIRKFIFAGDRYRSNQAVLFEEEKAALRATLKERSEFLEDCMSDKARMLNDIADIQRSVQPQKDKVESLTAEAEALHEETRALTTELMANFQDAMLALRSVEAGDIMEMQNIKAPTADVLRVARAVLLLFGIGPVVRKQALHTRHTFEDWWTPALELFRDRDIIHRLRHYNKKAVPQPALEVIRTELLPHGGLDYEDGDTNFRFIYALARWVRAIEMYERVGSIITQRTHREADLRQESFVTHESYATEREMVEMRQHRVKFVEVDISALSDECFNLRRQIGGYQEKIRLSKLFEFVAYSGHTLVSWAGAVGSAEIMGLLLAHGGTLGWGAEYETLLSNAVKTLWKAKKQREAFKRRGRVMASERGLSMQLSWALKKITNRMVQIRKERRSPLTEAYYNGNFQVAERLAQAPCLSAVLYTYNQPVAAPPGPGLKEGASMVDFSDGPATKLSVLDYARQAAEERACCDFVHSVGWTRKDHPMSKWVLNTTSAEELFAVMEERRKKSSQGIANRRQKKKTIAKLKALEQALDTAISSTDRVDWWRVMKVLDDGADPDYERPGDGLTCLLAAATEDTDAVNYTYVDEIGGRGLTALELLLNRMVNRPTVDFESARLGHTAMSWAAYHGRLTTIQLLAERGADVKRANREGLTPLMFSAMNGKSQAVAMLLELGADPAARDAHNRSAEDHGRDYADVLGVLGREHYHHVGEAKAKMGVAQPRVPCLRGCGLILLRTEMQEHVSNHCPHRLVACKWGCDTADLFAKEKLEHEERLCLLRRRECPQECGEILLGPYLEVHMKEYCSKRMLPCPDKCGQQVRLDRQGYHRLHECSHRLVPCPLECGLSVRFFELYKHRRAECKLRKVRCRVTCGLDMYARDRQKHETETCPNRLVSCRYRCSKGVFRACEQHKHEEEACSKRPVPCPNRCGDKPMADDVKNHMANACAFRFVSCQRGCGLKVRAADMSKHMTEGECRLREVECPLGCGAKLVLERREGHMAERCPYRTTKCAQCAEPIRTAELAEHKISSCTRRMVTCTNQAAGCAKVLPANEMQEHETQHCKKRLVYCLQGCKQELRLDKRELHHQRQCPLRYVPCPQGCGNSIREAEKEEHMEKDCVRRPLTS